MFGDPLVVKFGNSRTRSVNVVAPMRVKARRYKNEVGLEV